MGDKVDLINEEDIRRTVEHFTKNVYRAKDGSSFVRIFSYQSRVTQPTNTLTRSNNIVINISLNYPNKEQLIKAV